MSKPDYEYTQHPHAEKRKEAGPVLTHADSSVFDSEPAKRSAGERIGLAITKGVGSMWAAGIFMGITLISLPAAIASGNEMTIVTWVAQTFLQLVLLPVIIVGQNIQAAAADARAVATYEDATDMLEEAKQIQHHLEAQDQALQRIEKGLKK
jgi:hypothetical protein